MKIRTKLSLIFTFIFAVVLFIVLAFSYTTAVKYTSKEFFERLEDRAFVAAQFFLEKDELSEAQYQRYWNKYLQCLNHEVIQVYDYANNNVFIVRNDSVSFSKETIEKVRNEKNYKAIIDARQSVGVYYKDNQGDFVILASAIDTYGKSKLENLLETMILGFLASVCLIYFLGRYFSKQALEPITNIVKQVKNITASNLHVRVDEGKNKDEISNLASAFNNVLEKLETSFEVQKTFVSNASHEMRTPLTSIIGELEVLLSKERSIGEYQKTNREILNNVEDLKELVNNLLSLAQASISLNEKFIEEIRIDELLMEIKHNIISINSLAQIDIDYINLPEQETDLIIQGNKSLLITALANIIENAIKFSDNRKVKCQLSSVNNKLHLIVIDSGIGISVQDLEKITQPFFRAENVSGYFGHGVGLSLAEKIIKMHGATLYIKSVLNEGTTVEIIFS